MNIQYIKTDLGYSAFVTDNFGSKWYWNGKKWTGSCPVFAENQDDLSPLPFDPKIATDYQEWMKKHGNNCHPKCLCMINPFSG